MTVVRRVNDHHALLTVHSASHAKTVEVWITDGDTVVYDNADFTHSDVAALVQAAYLLGREHAGDEGTR
jgi:hypothetical protein